MPKRSNISFFDIDSLGFLPWIRFLSNGFFGAVFLKVTGPSPGLSWKAFGLKVNSLVLAPKGSLLLLKIFLPETAKPAIEK